MAESGVLRAESGVLPPRPPVREAADDRSSLRLLLVSTVVSGALLLSLGAALLAGGTQLLEEDLRAVLPPEAAEVAVDVVVSDTGRGSGALAASLCGLWLVVVLLAGLGATRLARSSRRVRALARDDQLTGLPNRASFREQGQEMLARPLKARDPLALVVLDLDRFREINDALGHAYGDLVLKEVARRLEEAAPLGSVVARLAGDEFALLMPVGPDVDLLGERLQALRREVAEDVEVDGVPVLVEASLGLALAPLDGHDLDTLLRRADVAVAWAKQARGVARWERERDVTDPRSIALLAELRAVLEDPSVDETDLLATEAQLELLFQPKVDCRTGRVRSLEALVRWQHPELGLLTPERFVPLAERTGLIAPLTRRVVHLALSHLNAWGPEADGVELAVNVSAKDLGMGLAETVTHALALHDVRPQRLVLEVTETAMVHDPDTAAWVLGRLVASGVRVALDDFGRGHTSLSLLRRLPFHELKVDRLFVTNILEERHDEAVVTATLQLGHALGLTVVAEGVETSEVADRLRVLGCDALQGYLFGRPAPAREVPALLARLGVSAAVPGPGPTPAPGRPAVPPTPGRPAVPLARAAVPAGGGAAPR